MCEIAWNIGRHCLLVGERSANWTARSFRFYGVYREIVRYDCSNPDLRSSKQHGSDESAGAQSCARRNVQAAMILHERVGWKSEVQSIPMGVEK
jgi:hypothetical protein